MIAPERSLHFLSPGQLNSLWAWRDRRSHKSFSAFPRLGKFTPSRAKCQGLLGQKQLEQFSEEFDYLVV